MRSFYARNGGLQKLLSIGDYRRRSRGRRRRSAADDDGGDGSTLPARSQRPTWRCFSCKEIHRATAGFHPDNFVGRGGHAEVYRGVLDDRRVVAVKRLARAATVDGRREEEFLTELGTVCHVRHPNVAALLGCCVDGRDLHLVFELASRGSLSSLLHDESSPPVAWKLRHRIAVGAARGLRYLHQDCRRRIIHRDIKSSNVLVSADYEAQISDFGLARWLPSEWTHRAVAPIEGTLGYLAPEYFTQGMVDEKTDVFAFGVLLLELISGREPVDAAHRSLLAWSRRCWEEHRSRRRSRESSAADRLRRLRPEPARASAVPGACAPAGRPGRSHLTNRLPDAHRSPRPCLMCICLAQLLSACRPIGA